MWLFPSSSFDAQTTFASLPCSVQFTLFSFFYPHLPFLLVNFPLSFVSRTSNFLPICPPCSLSISRTLCCTRGCVLRACQLHLAESELEATSVGGPVGRLWAQIPKSFWGRRRSGRGGDSASYPSLLWTNCAGRSGEVELVQHHSSSLHSRGRRTHQPHCGLQNRRGW